MHHASFDTDEFTAKTYDWRLLKRIIKYVLPHKKLVVLSMFCMLLATAVQLMIPYLTKEGIDRYLATLYHLCRPTGDAAAELAAHPLAQAARPDARWTGNKVMQADAQHWLIRKTALTDLPVDLRRRLLQDDPSHLTTYYLFPATARTDGMGRVIGDFWLVPENRLSSVPPDVLVRMRGQDLQGITGLAILLGAMVLISMFAGYGHFLAIQVAGQRAMRDLRIKLFSHIESMDLRYLDSQPVGRLVTRVANDIEALNEFFAAVVINIVKDILLLSGTLVILLMINLTLGLIVLGIVPLVVAVALFFRNRMRRIYQEVRRLLAKLNADLSEDLNGVKVIQSFNRQAARREHFEATNHKYFTENFRQTKTFGMFRPIIDLLAYLVIALVLLYGGIDVLAGGLTIGALVAFLRYVRQMFKPIADMSERYNIMQRAMASLDRIFKVFDLTPAIADPVPSAAATPAPAMTGQIDFDNVSFAYVPEKTVLTDVSFSVPAGKSVAIVGPTGAGKTTVINLVCRFYDPNAGGIRIDGQDIRDLPLSALSDHISIVLQDAFIFSRSVEDNIRLGKDLDRQAVVQAADIVQARDFVEALPDGFDTVMAERGATLSTGQKQLLCFARALAHDPRILILDEATSSIDPDTEKRIQQAIETLMAGRTSIIIAHRLSTIRKADQILVMDGGRIYERGTHEELLAKRGIYYNLYLLQYQNGNHGPGTA